MAKVVNPEAVLEPHASDVPLTDKQLLRISLFAQLKRPPSLDKFPGALILRHYRKGEVIFRQGEAGWTAFYPLTSEDVAAILEGGGQTPLPFDPTRTMYDELDAALARLRQLQGVEAIQELRRVATVHLAIAQTGRPRRRGLLARLLRGPGQGKRERPRFIPIDGPRDVEYDSLQSPIYEGELFGEMSCLFRTPRSATVVAERDCYMLEMLRNILDQLQKDPVYKAQTDEAYKKRVLQLHLRNLPLFSELTEEQFAVVRSGVELVSFGAGQIIFDEHDRSDAMYLVRSGMVKVVKKTSALLGAENVRSWGGLFTALREGAQDPASPRGKVWQLLPESARVALEKAGSSNQLPPEDRREVLYGLNDLIKGKQLAEAKELQPLAATPEFRERIKDYPANRKLWGEREQRRYNRWLLEAVFAGILREHRLRVGPDCVLSYCARGEFIGEIGLLAREPRSATCLAAGHPLESQGKETGRVELVRIPEALFRQLLEASPSIRQKVERRAAERLKATQERVREPVYKEPAAVQLSERFEKLGLIQGQRLMLIDLDRCTRCDECVKACVATHDDGRSRLFLDGPRFGHYLVPVTCRSCLDPVCMIGCPVGSIHRGDLGQIVIEDWCIGCGLCANQCPYGSIQMHDIGLIPEGSRGWRYTPEAGVGPTWMQPRYPDHAWELGVAPFRHDRDLQALLQARQGKAGAAASAPAVCFRYAFNLASYILKPGATFRLEVTSCDDGATVWLNGMQLTSEEKPKRGKREYPLPFTPSGAAAPVQPLRVGRNLLAARVTAAGSAKDVLLAVRLDAVPQVTGRGQAEEVTEKLVTEQAVVCDLCSTLSAGPACVNACPHDAAMRVDARFEFPER